MNIHIETKPKKCELHQTCHIHPNKMLETRLIIMVIIIIRVGLVDDQSDTSLREDQDKLSKYVGYPNM